MQWPPLAGRPFKKSEMMQRPEYDMHMLPCANASSSRESGSSACMAAMSASDISRAHTTRLAPRACQARAAAELHTLACVLTCSSTCGACVRASANAPMSEMMSASTPAARAAPKNPGSSARSASCITVLQARCTFTPRPWA